MKSHGALMALVLVSIGVSACAVKPRAVQPSAPVALPERWDAVPADAPEASRPPVDWWTSFHEPELTRVVELALDHNQDLNAAASRVAQAAAQAEIAGAGLFPQIQAGMSGARRKQNFIGLPIPGREGAVLSTLSTNLGVSVDVSWEADLWGRLSADARSSIAGLQASAADLDAARLSLAGQTSKAWFALAEASEQLRLAEATVESFRRSSEQVRDRFESGLRPSLDYRLSLSNLAGARALAEQRRQQLDAARRQIEVLVGRYPEGSFTIPTSLGGLTEPVPGGLPSELLFRRPDLVAAERRYVAASEQVTVAERARYPRLSLTTSGGTASRELTDLVNGDFSVWSLVGNLVQPLFEGGRLSANVDRAEASEEETVALYASQVLSAYLEVETALAAEHHLATREASLEQAARQSSAAAELAGERYRSGLSDYITVLESQRRALEAESSLLSARRGRLENRVDLYLALGGGFDAHSIPDLEIETSADADVEDPSPARN